MLSDFESALLERGWRPARALKDDSVSSVWLLEGDDGPLLAKRSRFLAAAFGLLPRLLTAREVRILEALEGLEGIPRVHARLDACTFVRDFVPARPLSECSSIPDDFFERLLQLLDEVHQRGVACVDLSKRDNILVGDDGAPVLMDFQASMWLPPGSLRASFFGPLLRALQRGDRHHVYKHHRRRFEGAPIPPLPPELLSEPLGVRLHRVLLRRPYLAIRRALQGRQG